MKKILSYVLVFAFVFSIAVTGVSTTASAVTAGDGTEANPYIIKTEADFKVLDQSTQYIYAELGNSIELTQSGATIQNFNGELDGKGFTITNNKPSTDPFINTFVSGVLKNYNWNLETYTYMVLEQRMNQNHLYEDITVTGDVSLGSGNNNESPIVVYADGDTTMRRVTLDMDFTSETYNGLFIGYEPVKNSDYVFEDCVVKGTYLGDDVGILFGNGSMAQAGKSDYGLQHVVGANGETVTSSVTVDNLDLSQASIIGISSVPHLLCGISYQESSMGTVEAQLKANTTGYDDMAQAVKLEGYRFVLNEEGNLKIVVESPNASIGRFVISSEIYSNVYENGISNGTMKHSVTERIDVIDGVEEYYSSLGKVEFYDGKNGTFGTTGLNGELDTITVDGKTYYTLSGNYGDVIYTFGSEAQYSETAKKASRIKVFVYDKNDKLVNIVAGPTSEDFQNPQVQSVSAKVGTVLRDVVLNDGWEWVEADTEVVLGGQIAFAKKGTQIAPVTVTGEPVPAEKVELDKAELSLEKGTSDTLKATVEPVVTTDTVTWESKDTAVAVVDENGVVTATGVGKTTVIAKAGDKTAECTVTVYEVKADTPALPSGEVEEVTAGMAEDAAKEAETVLNSMVDQVVAGNTVSGINQVVQDAILNAVEQGKVISTEVAATTLENAPVEAGEIKNAIQKLANKYDTTFVVGQYLDLTVNVLVDGKKVGNITELDSPIEFSIAVPKEIKDEAKVYFVARMHENEKGDIEISFIPAKLNEDGVLTFVTDRFSTYALTYTTEDINVEENGNAWVDVNDIVDPTPDIQGTVVDKIPETGDSNNLVLPLVLLTIAVVAMAAVVILRKRNA